MQNVEKIPIEIIKPYHNHPFHLYEGERLEDMVDSIRTHGVLNPVIVRQMECGTYEMLAGHNRMNAAQKAGLLTLPAIVKTDLTEEEAWLYVVETNLRQRSFDDLLPSEQAEVLYLQYGKMSNQGKRSDIARELALLDRSPETNVAPKNSRQELAERYSLSSTTVARLLRLHELIDEFKKLVDNGKLPLLTAVEISYLPRQEQQWLHEFICAYTYKADRDSIVMLRQRSRSGGMTRETLWAFLIAQERRKRTREYQSVKLPERLYRQYFAHKSKAEAAEIMEKALEFYHRNIEELL